MSKFGPKLAGAGGFINISQNAKSYCGHLAGLKISVADGLLKIDTEGRVKNSSTMSNRSLFPGITRSPETSRFCL
ncbi:MAG: hypothetical protein R2875_04600 [Desulfobacterales bacterium]